MSSTLSLLDQAELLQLALEATRNGASADALAYLKEAASRSDASAHVHLLLGAEYAQLRLHDRAVASMEAAVALDPSLGIARLQLGLLYLTSGDGARALAVFAPLEETQPGEALGLMARGLRHLIHDEFGDAVEYIERGMALNTANAPLNADMRGVLDTIAKLPAEDRERRAPADANSHVLLSAYTGNTKH